MAGGAGCSPVLWGFSHVLTPLVFPAGAALGPLLAGLISPTGWNNVFYMLIAADVLACLVGPSVEVPQPHGSAPQTHLPAVTALPPLPLQLLARVVVKEVRTWYGCMARKRGYVQRGVGC